MARRVHMVGSLDSFLDIVANSIGMLMLIIAMTAILNDDVRISLGTPMMAPARAGLEPLRFECRGNAVYPLELSRLPLDDYQVALATGGSFERINALGPRTRHYSASFHRDGFALEPLGTPGFGLRTILDEPEAFLEDVSAAGGSAESTLLYFLVRPDSHEVFRLVRDVAIDHGYAIGWDPYMDQTDEPLYFFFGPGGGLMEDLYR